MTTQSPPDVFNNLCPARAVLEVLAHKWALLVVDALAKTPCRTAELRRHISGISDKMLIQTLRNLELYGLVERRDFQEVPPKVEYRLTTLGRSLAKVVCAFDRWVEKNMPAVTEAKRKRARSKA